MLKKHFLLMIIFVETVLHFLGFFYEYKTQRTVFYNNLL